MICLFVLTLFWTITTSSSHTFNVRQLTEGSALHCCENRRDIEVYCHRGKEKNVLHTWETLQLHISLKPPEYDRFHGHTSEEVLEQFQNHKSSWAVNFFLSRKEVLKLNPFNSSCIGIVTTKNYDVKLHRIRVDYWRILLCLSGIVLFILAPKLSKNSLFYYLTGVSVGTCAFALVLVYILSRFLPRKPLTYGFIAGGWTVAFYLAQIVWENLKQIAIDYRLYVIYYMVATGLISFIVCYRLGPVSDPRSINLIKWALQTVGLILIFGSTDYHEAGMALVLLLLVFYNTPIRVILNYFSKIKNRWYPPRPRLLTAEEYYEEGSVETKKALDSLRGYCSSPECNQWKTVLRLKNPMRFAKFVEGGSHIDDDEILSYDIDGRTNVDDLISDDESESD